MKNFIRHFGTFSLLTVFGIVSWGCSSKQSEFTFTNTLSFDRMNEPVVLSREDIIAKTGEISIREGMIPVPYEADGSALPSQIDDRNMDGEWDELAFLINLPANEEKTITIRFVDRSEVPDFPEKTNVRFGVLEELGVQAVEKLTLTADELPVPLFERFQMDGPAWENDKVGFRQYIDGRNGRDLYGKTSPEMALDTVGISNEGTLEDNYHEMLPWGRDILAVGNSLGLGGLAISKNKDIVRLGVRLDAERNNVDTTHYQLISEGPVRSIFRLTYTGWNTGYGEIDLTNEVEIWAGQYGYTNKVSLRSNTETDTLVVGMVNIHNDKAPELLDETSETHTAFYTHDRQTYDKEWFLGMGLVFPSKNYIGFMNAPDSGPGVTNSFLHLFELSGSKTLEYKVYAGWELSDPHFAERDYFHDFMESELQKTANPLIVE